MHYKFLAERPRSMQFLYSGIRALDTCWIECISVAEDYVQKLQHMMYVSFSYLCQSTNFLNDPCIAVVKDVMFILAHCV